MSNVFLRVKNVRIKNERVVPVMANVHTYVLMAFLMSPGPPHNSISFMASATAILTE
ncbi:hypothetical protein D3C71_2210040 [compost metagenome]